MQETSRGPTFHRLGRAGWPPETPLKAAPGCCAQAGALPSPCVGLEGVGVQAPSC